MNLACVVVTKQGVVEASYFVYADDAKRVIIPESFKGKPIGVTVEKIFWEECRKISSNIRRDGFSETRGLPAFEEVFSSVGTSAWAKDGVEILDHWPSFDEGTFEFGDKAVCITWPSGSWPE